jgi:flagellar biosynthesis chaperone FliJ
MTKIKRMPRPAGFTLLAKKVNDSKAYNLQVARAELIKLVVNHYSTNNFTFCGRAMTIKDLAEMMDVPVVSVMREMARYSKQLASIADPQHVQETQQVLVGMLLQNAMSDRAKVSEQVDRMIRSQGDEYKAFISKEVNASLKNLMESNKSLEAVAKLLQGPAGTFIQNNFNEGDKEVTEEAIGPNEAIKLLSQHDSISPLESPEKRTMLTDGLNSQKLPEVIATKQQGHELQGDFSVSTSLQKGKHIDRNEDDGDIISGIEDVEPIE